MAHPETPEALDVRPLDTTDDAAAALDDYFAQQDEDEPVDDDSPEDDAPEGDEPEDDEQDDESDEPETAIDAPVSLNAEEKAVFAQLPVEAQQAWAASETRRNAQVQEATTKAAHAERSAKTQAAEAHSKAKAVFATQLAEFASHLSPQMPDAELARVNPGEYIAQKAQYDAMKAQHDELVQQVAALGDEASQEIDQAFIQQRDRELLAIPEVANEETRGDFFDRALGAAEALGYERDILLRDGNATDFKALVAAHGWKQDADKYKALMAKQMTRVREAKSAKPNAAQPLGSGKARAQVKTQQRLRETGDIRDAAAAITALG
ncbi:hypothetical protein CDQ92_13195 [Sphingopyxis bauzanensis]|uniref:Phage capsid protein n=1 Tax=Sphingopyxis bauzanensis TaxID=651663 RepID=A0A246JT79_9SPHN|nr:hypothetical protein [Sphingopyxis bauzanensis]OWQ95732.1 hypothetical protein CDQ92_13195 [Sphingopyxis bauzanensis]GGJ39598.1 hypothetical protein GCM10011393_07260 [Sphingopyxis bauzanensis]